MRLLLWGFGFSRIVKSIPLTRCPRPRALRCSSAGGDDLGNVRQEWLPHTEKWKSFYLCDKSDGNTRGPVVGGMDPPPSVGNH